MELTKEQVKEIQEKIINIVSVMLNNMYKLEYRDIKANLASIKMYAEQSIDKLFDEKNTIYVINKKIYLESAETVSAYTEVVAVFSDSNKAHEIAEEFDYEIENFKLNNLINEV